MAINTDAEKAKDLIEKAGALLVHDLPELLDRIDAVLPIYARIPARLETFEILGVGRDEDLHTNALAWLLRPEENHGLGDSVLRRFLLLIDHRTAANVAKQRAIDVEVHTQFDLGKFGIPDLVLAIQSKPQLIVVIEAKMDARITRGGETGDENQTLRYRQAHQAGELAHRLKLQGDFATAFVFLPTHRDQEAEDEPEGNALEDVPRFQKVPYQDVVTELLDALRVADVDEAVTAFVRQFATSVLRADGAGDGIEAIQRLRLARQLARQSSMTLADRIRVVADLRTDFQLLQPESASMSDEALRIFAWKNASLIENLDQLRREVSSDIARDVRAAVLASVTYRRLEQALKNIGAIPSDYGKESERGIRVGISKGKGNKIGYMTAGVTITVDSSGDGNASISLVLVINQNFLRPKVPLSELALPAGASPWEKDGSSKIFSIPSTIGDAPAVAARHAESYLEVLEKFVARLAELQATEEAAKTEGAKEFAAPEDADEITTPDVVEGAAEPAGEGEVMRPEASATAGPTIA